jgi:hypothetical protein
MGVALHLSSAKGVDAFGIDGICNFNVVFHFFFPFLAYAVSLIDEEIFSMKISSNKVTSLIYLFRARGHAFACSDLLHDSSLQAGQLE